MKKVLLAAVVFIAGLYCYSISLRSPKNANFVYEGMIAYDFTKQFGCPAKIVVPDYPKYIADLPKHRDGFFLTAEQNPNGTKLEFGADNKITWFEHRMPGAKIIRIAVVGEYEKFPLTSSCIVSIVYID